MFGSAKRTGTQAFAIGGTRRAELGDMAERIGALVAVGRRIRTAADTEGIKNEEKGARHGSPDKIAQCATSNVRRIGRHPYNGGVDLAIFLLDGEYRTDLQ